jgi:polyhydroxyalkanoate synthesis repressor PhaR
MGRKHQDIIIIKKYANRRLYNTQTSTYITLDDLYTMIRKGEQFQVQDAKTGKDITHAVLIQIIFDHESEGYNLLPTSFLLQIIRLYDHGLREAFSGYLEMSMNYFLHNQEQFEKLTHGSFPNFQPFPSFEKTMEDIARQHITLMGKTMDMFSGLGDTGEKK